MNQRASNLVTLTANIGKSEWVCVWGKMLINHLPNTVRIETCNSNFQCASAYPPSMSQASLNQDKPITPANEIARWLNVRLPQQPLSVASYLHQYIVTVLADLDGRGFRTDTERICGTESVGLTDVASERSAP